MAPTPEQVQQMSTGATPLQVAGVTDTTPTPTAAPATEAPGALSGYPTAGVSAPLSDQLRNFSPIAVQRPGTATQAAKNADTLAAATPNPSKPGSWARSLVGGMQSALAGGGLEGVLADANVPNARSGAQALTQVMANRSARIQAAKAQAAAKKQQDIENQFKTNQDKRAQQEADDTHMMLSIALQQSIRKSTEDRQNSAFDDAKAYMANITDHGSRPVTQDLDSDKLMAWAQQNAPKGTNPLKWLMDNYDIVQDGWQKLTSPNGENQTVKDEWNNVQGADRRQTYSVMTWGDKLPITPQLIADYQKYVPGMPALPANGDLDPRAARNVETQIQHGKLQYEAAQKALEEAGETEDKIQKHLQSDAMQKAMPVWLRWVNDAKGDEGSALTNVINHANDPNLTPDQKAAAVQDRDLIVQGFGPQIVKDLTANHEKQQELNMKASLAKTAKNGIPAAGDTSLSGDAYLKSLANDTANGGSPGQAKMVQAIDNGQLHPGKWSYLLGRGSPLGAELMAYDPSYNGALLDNFPKHYQDFISGPTANVIVRGATAIGGLQLLKDTMVNPDGTTNDKFLIPGTDANRRFNQQLANTTSEVANYMYGPNKATKDEIQAIRDGLNVNIPVNINSAISQQAASIQQRYGSIMQDWVNGLPNAKWINAYAMPGFNQETMDTMAKLSGHPNPQQTGLKPAWMAPQGQPTNPAASQTTTAANATQTPTQNAAPKIPAGATHTVKGPDGKMHYTNNAGTVDYGIVQ